MIFHAKETNQNPKRFLILFVVCVVVAVAVSWISSQFFFLSFFIWWFIFLILFMIKEYLILFWFTQTQKFKHKQHKQQFFFFMNFYSRDLFFKKNKNKWHFEWIPFVILGSKLRSFSSSSFFSFVFLTLEFSYLSTLFSFLP